MLKAPLFYSFVLCSLFSFSIAENNEGATVQVNTAPLDGSLANDSKDNQVLSLEKAQENETVKDAILSEKNQEKLTFEDSQVISSDGDKKMPEDMNATPHYPDDRYTESSSTESERSDNEYCDTNARPMRITMRHIEDRGIGYNTGYTTLEGFFSLAPRSNVVPFLDLRGHIFNDNKWAANGGLGLRYLPDDVQVVFGINAFYDFRHVTHKSFQQAGAGLEFLGHVWEGRINGYLPFGDKRGPYSETKFERFKGNHIILQRRAQFTMRGIDAEAGAYLCQMEGFNAFFGLGPYGFAAKRGRAAIGGKARLTADFSDYVTAEVTASYDSVFRGIVQGELMINIPFFLKETTKRTKKGAFKSCETWGAMHNRLLDRVHRQEIIVVKKEKKRDTAIDPTTGKPFTVFFVNNTSSSAGTFASPFNTLLNAQNASSPNDIIYVYSGDGTTTGMNQGIILQDNQRLWGASTKHHLNTTLGRIVVPQHDTVAPTITNSATGVVQIANNNEISGFTIQNGNLNGIYQVSPVLSGLRVLNNSIVGTSSGKGILLNGLAGTVTVANNSFNQGSVACTIASQSVQNAHFTLQDNNIVIAATGSADACDITLNACSNSDVKILNNSISVQNNSGRGLNIIVINPTAQPANSIIADGNNISTRNNCILISNNTAANTNVDVSNNNLTSSLTFPLTMGFQGLGAVTVGNNNLTGQGGVQLGTGSSALVSASIINNNIAVNTSGQGVLVGSSGNSTLQCNVTNNAISVATSAQALGAAANFINNSNLCLTFNGNVANFVTPQAFEFNNSSGHFYVTPPMNNVGNIFENGTITQVTTLPCGL